MKLLISLLLLLPTLAQAGGSDRLKAFFASTNAISANFHQTVRDKQGRTVQEVDGTMQLQRPGKFRWDYNQPYVQQIVGDGSRVWLYDPELSQVTVRAVDETLGASPAALLAGNLEMERNFQLKDETRADNLEWVLATPRDEGSGFDRVYLGFNQAQLQVMELHDNFAHVTTIKFSQLQRNPKLSPQAFRFTPPPGVDVVGE